MTRVETPVRLSEIDPERTRRSVRAVIAEVRKLHRDRNRALLAGVKKGHLDFLLTPSTRTPARERRIQIFYSDEGKYCYFASAVVDLKIEDIENPNYPFDFLVREGKNIENPRDVTHSLAQYIQEFLPRAANIPFRFYATPKDYRNQKTLVEFVYPVE